MSDGFFTVSGLLKYLDEVYDVIAITDHNVVTVPHPLQLKDLSEDLLILKGVEVTFPNMHIVCIEPLVTNMGIIGLIRSSRVSWLAHPCYIPPFLNMFYAELAEQIVKREGLHGVELYTTGEAVYKGDPIGNFYAVDDLHIPSQRMTSWMEMEVDSIDKEIVIEKLISGDFELFNNPREDIE